MEIIEWINRVILILFFSEKVSVTVRVNENDITDRVYTPVICEKVRAENWSFLDAVRAGAFTVPGDGAIDFAPIFDVLAENGYEGYVLVEAEQDPAIANPFEYALKARKYIAEKAGL